MVRHNTKKNQRVLKKGKRSKKNKKQKIHGGKPRRRISKKKAREERSAKRSAKVLKEDKLNKDEAEPKALGYLERYKKYKKDALDYVADKAMVLGEKVNEKATLMKAQINVDSLKLIADDPEKWKIFGNGSEKSREQLKELIISGLTSEVIVKKSTQYFNESTQSFMSVMRAVAAKPRSEMVLGLVKQDYNTYKQTTNVSENKTFKMFEDEIKQEFKDDRDLTKCVFFGDVDERTPQHEIASFCMPEVNEPGDGKCLYLVCYNLAELQAYVKGQKTAGFKKIPMYYLKEIREKLPNANLEEYMSDMMVQAIEHYPTFEKHDVVIMSIIRWLYNYALTHVPYLQETLSFTEGVRSRIASITPQWVKSMLKRGKISLIYFMKHPRVIKTAVLVSKFLRLVCCVWISTWSDPNPAMSFFNISKVLVEMAEPLALGNPFFAIPYIWLKIIYTSKGFVEKILSFNIWGAMWEAAKLIWKSGPAMLKTLGLAQYVIFCMPFKIFLGGDNAADIAQGIGNMEGYTQEGLNKLAKMITGNDDTFGQVATGLKLVMQLNTENQNEWYLNFRSHAHEWLTMTLISFLPHSLVNIFCLFCATQMGPATLAAYTVVDGFVQMFYPGENVFIVMLTWAQRRGNALHHIYPFKELVGLVEFMHELYLWMSEVGKCGMLKLYDDYIAPYVEDIDPTAEKRSFAKCCMEKEVALIKETVVERIKKDEKDKLDAEKAEKEKEKAEADAKAEAAAKEVEEKRIATIYRDYSLTKESIQDNAIELEKLQKQLLDVNEKLSQTNDDDLKKSDLLFQKETLEKDLVTIQTKIDNLKRTAEKLKSDKNTELKNNLTDILSELRLRVSNCETNSLKCRETNRLLNYEEAGIPDNDPRIKTKKIANILKLTGKTPEETHYYNDVRDEFKQFLDQIENLQFDKNKLLELEVKNRDSLKSKLERIKELESTADIDPKNLLEEKRKILQGFENIYRNDEEVQMVLGIHKNPLIDHNKSTYRFYKKLQKIQDELANPAQKSTRKNRRELDEKHAKKR